MANRTCIGCREVAAPARLLRLVRGADGTPRPDLLARLSGRGAWVHPRPGCVRQAARAGLARAFRAETRTEPEALLSALQQAVTETVTGLRHRWERAGRIPGPLARRLQALDAAAGQLATGTRA